MYTAPVSYLDRYIIAIRNHIGLAKNRSSESHAMWLPFHETWQFETQNFSERTIKHWN